MGSDLVKQGDNELTLFRMEQQNTIDDGMNWLPVGQNTELNEKLDNKVNKLQLKEMK